MGYGPLRAHFTSRRRISIDRARCVGCKLCIRSCPVGTVIGYREDEGKAYLANARVCGGCGACLRGCPSNAIHLVEAGPAKRPDGDAAKRRAPGQPRPKGESGS